jgi:hypothetical protein
MDTAERLDIGTLTARTSNDGRLGIDEHSPDWSSNFAASTYPP